MSGPPTETNAPAPRARAPWWFSWSVWLLVIATGVGISVRVFGVRPTRHPVLLIGIVVLAQFSQHLAARCPLVSKCRAKAG